VFMGSNIPSLKRAYTGRVFKLNNEIEILPCIKYYATLHSGEMFKMLKISYFIHFTYFLYFDSHD